MSEEKPLAGRIAVVTGASRGIGYQAAKGFAAAGAHVVAVARTVGGLEELDDDIRGVGGAATLVPLDLQGFAGIDRLGAAIFERWGKLDVLVANAGVLGQLSPLGHVPPKVWDEVIAINVTANWRLIRSLDPLLRQSDAGRALFMSSGAAQHCRPYLGPLLRLEGGARSAGAHLCRRDRRTRRSASSSSIPGQTRTAHARQGDAGRRPDDAAEARGDRAAPRGDRLAVVPAHERALRLSRAGPTRNGRTRLEARPCISSRSSCPCTTMTGTRCRRSNTGAWRPSSAQRFGGLTAYTRAPAEGIWSDEGARPRTTRSSSSR